MSYEEAVAVPLMFETEGGVAHLVWDDSLIKNTLVADVREVDMKGAVLAVKTTGGASHDTSALVVTPRLALAGGGLYEGSAIRMWEGMEADIINGDTRYSWRCLATDPLNNNSYALPQPGFAVEAIWLTIQNQDPLNEADHWVDVEMRIIAKRRAL